MKEVMQNIYFKLGVILILLLVLLIPTNQIKNLVYERAKIHQEAADEVSQKWGYEQTIAGPCLSIPFKQEGAEEVKQEVKQETESGDSRNWNSKKTTQYYSTSGTEYYHIMPDELKISGAMDPETRNRGIHEVVVYDSKLKVSGSFKKISLASLDIPLEKLDLSKAILTVGINDLRGIEKQVALKWNAKSLFFNSGVINSDLVQNGIHANINLNESHLEDIDFSFDLNLKGSQKLYFTPVGKVTDVKIASTWKNPSFDGSFLPDQRTVNKGGFTANWNVLHLNRSYPQQWKGNTYNIHSSAFGLDLFQSVNNYSKTYRSVQYAILFLVLTFLVFFFIEVIKNQFIHPIQYLLVGIALVVFFTLLLSISEHLSYNLSYVIASASTILLIAGYVKTILKSNALVMMFVSLLTVLYTFIFIIIQSEDYALLIGSVGIFIILGLVMYFSRKINWLTIGSKTPVHEAA